MSHVDSEHAPISPSAMHITLKCSGAPHMIAKAPKLEDTDEILQGKAQHRLNHLIGVGGVFQPGETFKFDLGQKWTVTQGMLECAYTYIGELGLGRGSMFEEPVACHRIHPQCWGTPDYRRYIPKAQLLKVVEYKNGKRYVDEFRSPQGIPYIAGIADQLSIPDSTRTKFVVVQPNCYSALPVREWNSTVGEVRELAKDLSKAAHAALSPEAQTVAGAHCLDCKAAVICGTLQRAAERVLHWQGKPTPVELTGDALGTELALLQEGAAIVKARKEALETAAEIRIKDGQRVLGYKLGRTVPREKWRESVTDDNLRALETIYDVEILGAQERATPVQVRAQLPKDDKAAIELLSYRPVGKSKLERIDSNETTKVLENGKQ